MLRWEKGGRYYTAFVQQDLFEGWVVTHIWGRKGTRLGKVRNVPCEDEARGRIRLEKIDRKRLSRGYRRVQ